MELKWTEKSEAHIARHGVFPAEVEEVLSSRPLSFVNGREGTVSAYGRTYAGRYLVVVLAGAEDGRHFVVTARDMSLKELRHFRKGKG